MSPSHDRGMQGMSSRWASQWAVALLGAAIAAKLGHLTVSNVERCDAVLRAMPEPAGWSSFPILPDRGGFEARSEYSHRKYNLGLHITALQPPPGVCPLRGIAPTAWPMHKDRPEDMVAYWTPYALQVRARGDVLVLTGVDDSPSGPVERYFAAYQRVSVSRHEFITERSERLAEGCAAGLALLAAATLFARSRRARARAFSDPARYTPGRRDAAGAIHFDDGAAPIPADVAPPGAPGPVLVEISGARQGSYRRRATTIASHVVEGRAEVLVPSEIARGAAVLAVAFWLVVVSGACVAGCLALTDALRDLV